MNKSYAAKSRPIIATKYEPSIMRAINISRERSSNDCLHAIPSKPKLPEMKLIPTQRSNKSSRERIKVFDVFENNKLGRNKSVSHHVKRLEDSREILKQLPRPTAKKSVDCQQANKIMDGDQETYNKFFKPKDTQRQRSISNRLFKDKLFKLDDNSISYIRPMQAIKDNIPNRKIRINYKRIHDENILDLLLLNTCELKQKLVKNTKQNVSFIRIHPGKLPRDFFDNQ